MYGRQAWLTNSMSEAGRRLDVSGRHGAMEHGSLLNCGGDSDDRIGRHGPDGA
jgi:hypothetical protein